MRARKKKRNNRKEEAESKTKERSRIDGEIGKAAWLSLQNERRNKSKKTSYKGYRKAEWGTEEGAALGRKGSVDAINKENRTITAEAGGEKKGRDWRRPERKGKGYLVLPKENSSEIAEKKKESSEKAEPGGKKRSAGSSLAGEKGKKAVPTINAEGRKPASARKEKGQRKQAKSTSEAGI